MPLSADQLADQLRDEIRNGELPVGTVLPSIRRMVVERSASISVVNRALDKLKLEGLVESQHGSKSVVRGGFQRVKFRAPTTDADPAQGAEIVRVAETPAPGFVADWLAIDPGDDVVVRTGEHWHSGRRVGLMDYFIPVELARGGAAVYTDAGPGGVHARLAERGFRPTRFVLRALARAALAEEARVMELRPGAFVLEVICSGLVDKRCVEVVRNVLDADVFELEATTIE